ncbi:radical SAM protein [Intestinibacter bartlettii]|uniref:Radical SAM protein n=1 Tax=Intestinibacter bartlettii TaxID=261299 RepID=A0ABS6DYG7_9FIRM|nr:radical SAM protein [Intestinibacter bartlettii]MBU5336896.1 radical SAM protein [Intestinibacter bartlettii]
MKDGFNRDIDYLKISLTNICDLKCTYCMPQDSESSYNNINKFLSLEDYKFIIKSMSELGIKKIEFTGGEPLLNPNLEHLIYYAKNYCNIEEVIVTTNGIKFAEKAINLKNAGLDKVNISINSLKEYKYESLTRGGNLGLVLKSFNTALRLNIDTNIDTLIINNFNDDEINDFIQLANNFPITLRFFELMYVGKLESLFNEGYINVVDLIDNMEGMTKINSDDKLVRHYYKKPGSKGKIGIISRFNDSNCWNCDKISLSYDGKIRLCTYENKEYDILNFINKPLTFSEVMKEIITYKPKDFNEIKNNITYRNLNEL